MLTCLLAGYLFVQNATNIPSIGIYEGIFDSYRRLTFHLTHVHITSTITKKGNNCLCDPINGKSNISFVMRNTVGWITNLSITGSITLFLNRGSEWGKYVDESSTRSRSYIARSLFFTMWKILGVACFVGLAGHVQVAEAQFDRSRAIQVEVEVETVTPSITLNWTGGVNGVTDFDVARADWLPVLNYNSLTFEDVALDLPAETSQWTDTDVSVGNRYVYRIRRNGNFANIYVDAGIELPAQDDRGTLILVVEDAVETALTAEVDLLTRNLIGDGWKVQREVVNRSDSVGSVRDRLITISAATSDVEMLFLLGRIPVPYSGFLAPDGHQDHQGAWPNDFYYGFLRPNGMWEDYWTDTTVNTTTDDPATIVRNENIPGDGKFDQSIIPFNSEPFAVGRVDMANMPAFSTDEIELIRQYLEKNHAYRHRLWSAQEKATLSGSSNVLTAWEEMASMFGSNNLVEERPFPETETNSYLWSVSGTSGEFDWSSDTGNSWRFNFAPNFGVFFRFAGSYFGDWDSIDAPPLTGTRDDESNNFLRGPLAADQSWGLGVIYGWQTGWRAQAMALGLPIGMTGVQGRNPLVVYVHHTLMGDPSLRLHILSPPVNLSVSEVGDDAVLTWAASPDSSNSGFLGYTVFRADALDGPYTKLTSSPISTTTYTDQVSRGGEDAFYMVRSVELRSSFSGSYVNTSQGIFNVLRTDGTDNTLPVPLTTTLTVVEDTPELLNLSASDADGDAFGFSIVEKPANGRITGYKNGMQYVPNKDFAGVDTLTYIVFDSYGQSSVTQINISVTQVNDRPVGDEFNLSAASGIGQAITLTGSDAEGDPFNGRITTQPMNGTLTGTFPNYIYTANSSYSGPDSFGFTLNDAGGDGPEALVTVDVTSGLPALVGLSVDQGLYYRNYLGNFSNTNAFASNASLEPASIGVVDAPTRDAFVEGEVRYGSVFSGYIEVPESGTYTFYTRTRDIGDLYIGGQLVLSDTQSFSDGLFSGSISLEAGLHEFMYLYARRGESGARLTLTYEGPGFDEMEIDPSNYFRDRNAAPISDQLALPLAEDTQIQVDFAVYDYDEDEINYRLVTGPLNGTLSGSTLSPIYTPDADYHGSDSFIYALDDGLQETLITVELTVTPVNDSPAIQQPQLFAAPGETISFELTVDDIDDDTFTWLISPARWGKIEDLGPGGGPSLRSFSYQADPDYTGGDSFSVTVEDAGGLISQLDIPIVIGSDPDFLPNRLIVLEAKHNDEGILGLGAEITLVSEPTPVPGMNGIESIAGSLVKKRDGTIWGWGPQPLVGDGGTESRYTPVQIPFADSVSLIAKNWASVRTSLFGTLSAYALADDGDLWAWGDNQDGKLGIGIATPSSSAPVEITTTSGFENVWTGISSVFASKTDGSLWGWGVHFTSASSTSLLRGESSVSSANPFADAVDFPEQQWEADKFGAGVTVVDLSSEYIHAIAALSDGRVVAWGSNDNGALGNGLEADAPVTNPVFVQGLTDVIQVETGYLISVALKSDGTVWAWGRTHTGILGVETVADPGETIAFSNVPVQVMGLSDIVQISGEPSAFYTSTIAALDAEGRAWLWSNFTSRVNHNYLPYPLADTGFLTDIVMIDGGFMALERYSDVVFPEAVVSVSYTTHTPQVNAVLDASGSASGVPIVSYTWSDGAGSLGETSPILNYSFPAGSGEREVTLTVTDQNGVQSSRKVTLVDQSPWVDAGEDVTMRLGTSHLLEGTAVVEGSSPATLWSVESGPGDLVFNPEDALNSLITPNQVGRYEALLTVTDGASMASDGLLVQVVDDGTDIDGDGISDGLEFDQFGNLSSSGFTSDTDSDGMKDGIEGLGGFSPFVIDVNTMPVCDDFAYEAGPLMLRPTYWRLSGNTSQYGAVQVETYATPDGLPAVLLPVGVNLQQHVSGISNQTVWLSARMQLPLWTDESTSPQVSSDASWALYLDAEGQLYVRDGATWELVSGLSEPLPLSDWVRVAIHLNGQDKQWSLWIDGQELSTDLAFASSTAIQDRILIQNLGESDIRLADFCLDWVSPDYIDIDADGITSGIERLTGRDESIIEKATLPFFDDFARGPALFENLPGMWNIAHDDEPALVATTLDGVQRRVLEVPLTGDTTEVYLDLEEPAGYLPYVWLDMRFRPVAYNAEAPIPVPDSNHDVHLFFSEPALLFAYDGDLWSSYDISSQWTPGEWIHLTILKRRHEGKWDIWVNNTLIAVDLEMASNGVGPNQLSIANRETGEAVRIAEVSIGHDAPTGLLSGVEYYSNWAATIIWPNGSLDSLPDQDPDRDGIVNQIEFLRGSNPLVADTAYPLGLQYMGNEVELTFDMADRVLGDTFFLQRSTLLGSGSWENLWVPQSAISVEAHGAGQRIRINYTLEESFESEFFRLLSE